MSYRRVANMRLANKVNYVVNEQSMEIHDLDNQKRNCFINVIKYKTYITNKIEYEKYLKMDYNGCRWCNKKDDTD